MGVSYTPITCVLYLQALCVLVSMYQACNALFYFEVKEARNVRLLSGIMLVRRVLLVKYQRNSNALVIIVEILG